MFAKHGYRIVNKIEDADIVVFTGGADVDPQLYGEQKHHRTFVDPNRDQRDLAIWGAAGRNQLHVGICRGAQFLNVMCGGSLWQHVDKHAISGTHLLLDKCFGTLLEPIPVTSTHHQQMRPNSNGEILGIGIASETSRRPICDFKENGTSVGWTIVRAEEDPDVEVVWYREQKCFCFQPHPEYRHKPTEDYFFQLLEDYILPCVDKDVKTESLLEAS